VFLLVVACVRVEMRRSTCYDCLVFEYLFVLMVVEIDSSTCIGRPCTID